MIKNLVIGAFALAAVTGSAFADTTTGSTALDNQDKMGPFYTDSEMKTLKTDAEFKAAWEALTEADRDQFSKECDTDSEKLHNDFCEKTKQLGGAN